MQGDLDGIVQWAEASCMTLNVVNCWVLHLGHSNPTQCYRPGEGMLEICQAEKGLEVLVDSQTNVNQQGAEVAKKAKGILACIRNSVASRTREVTVPFCAVVVRPQIQGKETVVRRVFSFIIQVCDVTGLVQSHVATRTFILWLLLMLLYEILHIIGAVLNQLRCY